MTITSSPSLLSSSSSSSLYHPSPPFLHHHHPRRGISSSTRPTSRQTTIITHAARRSRLTPAQKNARKDVKTAIKQFKKGDSQKRGFGGRFPFTNNNNNNNNNNNADNDGNGGDIITIQRFSSNDGGVKSEIGLLVEDLDLDDEEDDNQLDDLFLSDTEAAELVGSSAPNEHPDYDELAGLSPTIESTLSTVLSHFSFPLDPFQISAVRRVLMKRSVVVCAPTGAGKTAIAEAAAIYFMQWDKKDSVVEQELQKEQYQVLLSQKENPTQEGGGRQGEGEGGKKRVIYTTPLKALSNQKLLELRERFGTDNVGLQTGDASVNPDAPIVVMTTEILRNILYRQNGRRRRRGGGGERDGDGSDGIREEEEAASTEEQQSSTSTTITTTPQPSITRLSDVGLVVLDEVHYLGDPGRGSVWEEVIIALPPDIQILAMSATIRNPDDLGGWISEVHGECEIVKTTWRPVPLKWQFCFAAKGKTRMLPLLENDDGSSGGGNGSSSSNNNNNNNNNNNSDMSSIKKRMKMNPALLPASRQLLEKLERASAAAWGRQDGSSSNSKSSRMRRQTAGILTSSRKTIDRLLTELDTKDDDESEEGGVRSDWEEEPRWRRVPSVLETVTILNQRKMLPAIWFIFSRKDCDANAVMLNNKGCKLTSVEEMELIKKELDGLRAEQPEAVKQALIPALLAGIASHHAGCLPAWKSLIEKLFQQGVLKLVFATETLAAGINMPAKTTIITALSRRRDAGIVTLQHNELLQMAGRAGRRGFDTTGNCVVLQSKWEDAESAWDIIKRGPESLKSQFTTGYGMVLNLLYTRSVPEAQAFLDKSFSRYMGGLGRQKRAKEIEQLENKSRAILDGLAAIDDGDGENGDGGAGSLWTKYQKLQGRLKEEKRAAKMLRIQISEERGQLSTKHIMSTMTMRGGRGVSGGEGEGSPSFPSPVFVGLDISAFNVEKNAYRLPAMVLQCITPRPLSSGRTMPPSSLELLSDDVIAAAGGSDDDVSGSGGHVDGHVFLCLAIDNCWYLVEGRHIGSVGLLCLSNTNEQQGEGNAIEIGGVVVPNEEQIQLALEHVESLRPNAWRNLAGGVKVASGSAYTAMLASKMPASHQLQPIQPPTGGGGGGMEALGMQRGRIRMVKQEINEMKADRAFIKASKKFNKQAQKAAALKERAEALREELFDSSVDANWRTFADQTAILVAAGALELFDSNISDGDTSTSTLTNDMNASASLGLLHSKEVKFTAMGHVARELNGSNELWLALVATHPVLTDIPPPQLAAVFSAIVAPDSVSARPGKELVSYPPSDSVAHAVEALEDARLALFALQIKAGVDMPIAIDLRLAGLVEAWASGANWSQLMGDCLLDDGDVARLLMRTVDVLKQVSYCEWLLPAVRQSSKKALRAMDRQPISDLVN